MDLPFEIRIMIWREVIATILGDGVPLKTAPELRYGVSKISERLAPSQENGDMPVYHFNLDLLLKLIEPDQQFTELKQVLYTSYVPHIGYAPLSGAAALRWNSFMGSISKSVHTIAIQCAYPNKPPHFAGKYGRTIERIARVAPAVEHIELWAFMGAVDTESTPHGLVCLASHSIFMIRSALPNVKIHVKFPHHLHFDETLALVERYSFGLLRRSLRDRKMPEEWKPIEVDDVGVFWHLESEMRRQGLGDMLGGVFSK